MTESVDCGDIVAGRYRVDRRIGKGEVGVVFAATDLSSGQCVAIKLLRPDKLGSPDDVKRFTREAQAAATLQSEHAVRVFDAGVLPDGAPYLVMECLNGTDLRTMLETMGPLLVGDAVDFIVDACEVLSEVHRRNIVHRDIKPANLFVMERPNAWPILKVLDFGISKFLASGDQDASVLTKTSTRLGTPAYMSPEQLLSAKDVDHRTDVWALGVVLYESLAGIKPFERPSLAEAIAAVLSVEPEALSICRPEVPAALSEVVHRCLEKDRSRRMATADALKEALLPFSVRRKRKQSQL